MARYPFAQMKAAISRVFYGEMYFAEFVGYTCHQVSDYLPDGVIKRVLMKVGNQLRIHAAKKRLLPFFEGQKFNFNGVLIPNVLSDKTLFMGLSHNYNDLFKIHCEYGGDYRYSVVDPLDARLSEGSYFYLGPNGEDIQLKPGDVVIDAGAWIGDFSALAAHIVGLSGKVYAFEPSPKTLPWLMKTATYYSNIQIISCGLGDKNEMIRFYDDYSGGGTFLVSDQGEGPRNQIVSLDEWVQENKITRLDFIKADIEGFERNMLVGAKQVLRDFAPILSICTYHLKDDPQVLEGLIRQFNPNYTVIQRQHKLFAYIPRI